MKRKGLMQSLVLATVLAAGFAAVWGVIALWALEVGAHVVGGRITSDEIVIPLRAVLLFLPDGTPVVSYQGAGRNRQLRDLQGNPVVEPDSEHPFLVLSRLPAKLLSGNTGEELSWDERIRSFADGHVQAGYWYFLCDGRRDGAGYFVGYDSESHACLGYLGTAGLREGPLPADELIPFTGAASDLNGRLLCTQQYNNPAEHPRIRSAGHAPHGSASTWDVYVLGRDGKLYHVDLKKKAIQVSFDRSPVLSAALTTGVPDAVHGTPHRPTVRTEDAVLVLDERGRVVKQYPIPESLRGQDIHFGETHTGEAVMYSNTPEDILASQVEYRICRVDAEGRCRQTTTVLPFVGMEWSVPCIGVVVPSPLGLAGTVAAMRPSMLRDEGLATTDSEALGRALVEFWPALAIAQLLALGFAVLCYRRQMRYGAIRSERIVWPLFVLLLGLPGWIGYRFGRRWPVLEKCPTCGDAVPRDRGECVRCTAEFPLPALKGTEVFA